MNEDGGRMGECRDVVIEERGFVFGAESVVLLLMPWSWWHLKAMTQSVYGSWI